VRRVLDMKVEDGARLWLIEWDGRDESTITDDNPKGDPWDDSWEPTINVEESLRREYIRDGMERARRTIQIDSRPLDTLVQLSVSQAVIGDVHTGDFGMVHDYAIEALTLKDLALHYINVQSERFGVEPQYDMDSDFVRTIELRLETPEQVGDWCDFGAIMAPDSAVKSLRYRCGRRQDSTVIIVGVVYFRFSENRRARGTGTFKVEFHTGSINGATGRLMAPHLGADSDSKLKEAAYLCDLDMYARQHLPDSHPLARAGWKYLARWQRQLAAPIGF
jgi:hypothetical protein